MTIQFYRGNVGYWVSATQYPYLTPDEAAARTVPASAVPTWAHNLAHAILAAGGAHLVLPPSEPDWAALVARGHAWRIGDGVKLRTMRGAASQCHANTAAWWHAHQNQGDTVQIATGYGLSDDDIWRQHSWGVWTRPRAGLTVVETTEPRLAYFGVVLSADEAEQFYAENTW